MFAFERDGMRIIGAAPDSGAAAIIFATSSHDIVLCCISNQNEVRSGLPTSNTTRVVLGDAVAGDCCPEEEIWPGCLERASAWWHDCSPDRPSLQPRESGVIGGVERAQSVWASIACALRVGQHHRETSHHTHTNKESCSPDRMTSQLSRSE